jgi:hypothetical protein
VQLELGGDKGGGELGVGGCTGTGAPNLRGDVMELLAVLVGDDGAGCSSSIGSNLVIRVLVPSSCSNGDSFI